MACEGNGLSDERIGEALIERVIQEELNDVPSNDVPPLILQVELQLKTEKKIVNQLGQMIRIIGDKVKDNQEFQDAIDGLACLPGCSWNRFKDVADKVFEHGITWEKIAVLIYVAGQLAVKMVLANLPQSVKDILKWTVDFFHKNLLGWIREHGGWISSFAELAMASTANTARSMSSQSYGLVLIFITGLALGSFITWRLVKHT